MKGKSEYIDLFLNSGCLSRTAIEGYLRNTLSEDALQQVQDHISHCGFCKDAVEGAALYSSPDKFGEDLDTLYTSIGKDITNERRSNRRLIIPVLSVAASLALLAGVFFYIRNESEQDKVVADETTVDNRIQEYMEPETTGKTKDSISQNADIVSDKKKVVAPKASIIEFYDSDDFVLSDSEQESEEEKIEEYAYEMIEVEEEAAEEAPDPVQLSRSQTLSQTEYYKESEELEARERSRRFSFSKKSAEGNEKQDVQKKAEKTTAGYMDSSVDEVSATARDRTEDDLNFLAENKSMDFAEYIKKSLPDSVKINQEITIECTFNSEGKVTSAKILPKLDKELEDIILEIVYASPPWKIENANAESGKHKVNVTLR